MTDTNVKPVPLLTATDFQTVDGVHTFSFFEGEDGTIYGWGYRDPVQFVAEVNEYDALFGNSDFDADPDAVLHSYAVGVSETDDGIEFRLVPEGTVGAVPITVLSR